MLKLCRSIATFTLMAIPLWVVLAGFFGFRPATLVVHLEQPDVRVFLNRDEYAPKAGAVGPLELEPGQYQLTIARDSTVLFSYPIVLEPGVNRELSPRWGARLANPLVGLQAEREGAEVSETDQEGSIESFSTRYAIAPRMD